jgi:hypothetical protein
MRILYRRFDKKFTTLRKIARTLGFYEAYLTFNNIYVLRPLNRIRFSRLSITQFGPHILKKEQTIPLTEKEKRFLSLVRSVQPKFIQRYDTAITTPKIPSLYYCELHNVELLGYAGFIFKGKKIIKESALHDFFLDRVEHQPLPKAREELPDKIYTSVHCSLLPRNNYFHAHVDMLARIYPLTKINKEVTILLPEHETIAYEIIKEVIASYPKLRLKLIKNKRYLLRRYIFLSPTTQPFSGYLRKEICEFITTHLKKKNVRKAKHIFIQRKDRDNPSRNVCEITITGVTPIHCEDLPLAEQRGFFAGAEEVSASHGAGLTNILFCKKGTKINEFLSRESLLPYYMLLSKAKNLDYRPIISKHLLGKTTLKTV